MRRIKVNDLYEFPLKLNVEPFTKEGLERREKQKNDGKEIPPAHPPSHYDYDLEGIVVHSGSADSGHYYSFIRDRDSSQWFQFNDSVIEPFNVDSIPSQCYGGDETSQVWDPQARKWVTKTCSKHYSAYMLFYAKSDVEYPMMLKTPSDLVPRDIYERVWHKNENFMWQQSIFDPEYFSFVWDLVMHVEKLPQEEYSRLAMPAIQLATCFLVNTLSRAKERENLGTYTKQLQGMLSRNIPACTWLLRFFEEQPKLLKVLLLLCQYDDVRANAVDLFMHVLRTLAPGAVFEMWVEEPQLSKEEAEDMEVDESDRKAVTNPIVYEHTGRPKSVLVRFMDTLLDMADDLPDNWRNFEQYFQLFYEFASIGPDQRRYLLKRRVMARFIDIFLAEKSPYAEFSKKRNRGKMGDKATQPEFGHMVGMCAVLVKNGDLQRDFDEVDLEIVKHQEFFSKSLYNNVNMNALCDLVAVFCTSYSFSKDLLETTKQGMNSVNASFMQPYFQILTRVLAIEDQRQSDRTKIGYRLLKFIVEENTKHPKIVAEVFKYVRDTAVPRLPLLRAIFWQHAHLFQEYTYFAQGETSELELLHGATRSMLQSLVPPAAPVAEGKQPPEPSEESVHALLAELLEHVADAKAQLPKVGEDQTGDHSSQIAEFLRLIRWCIRSSAQKQLVLQHADELLDLFSTIDGLKNLMDKNKLELVQLLLDAVRVCPEFKAKLLADDYVTSKLLHTYIQIDSAVPASITYNEAATPPFYELVHLLCKADEHTLRSVVTHQNFSWAITFVYLKNNFQKAGELIEDVLRMYCTSPASAAFRKERIAKFVEYDFRDDLETKPVAFMRYIGILLQSNEDRIQFCTTPSITTPRVTPFLKLAQALVDRQWKGGALETWAETMQNACQCLITAQSESTIHSENIGPSVILKDVCAGVATELCNTVTYDAAWSRLWDNLRLVLETLTSINKHCLAVVVCKLRDWFKEQFDKGAEPYVPDPFYDMCLSVASRAAMLPVSARRPSPSAAGIDLALLLACINMTKDVLDLLFWCVDQPSTSEFVVFSDCLIFFLSHCFGIGITQMGQPHVDVFLKRVVPQVPAPAPQVVQNLAVHVKQSLADFTACEQGDTKLASAASYLNSVAVAVDIVCGNPNFFVLVKAQVRRELGNLTSQELCQQVGAVLQGKRQADFQLCIANVTSMLSDNEEGKTKI
eukprot:TRINITY_DN3272_c0_g2_i6.p1 TRINITY_DN3272_c0_g2~~TRINITY_DN3272_c0_g2_i6.p1  ORF type:complete len:1195 (+),score=293.80 TRINITY_DN3272_c0_g2_i6:258-3842(+)